MHSASYEMSIAFNNVVVTKITLVPVAAVLVAILVTPVRNTQLTLCTSPFLTMYSIYCFVITFSGKVTCASRPRETFHCSTIGYHIIEYRQTL